MADARLKQIKIKGGIVKRIFKDKYSYEKEAEKQKQLIQKMKDDGKDEYEVRKQEEVLQETMMMIPDCLRRLRTAYSDLKNILESETDLAENEDYQASQAILLEAEKALA